MNPPPTSPAIVTSEAARRLPRLPLLLLCLAYVLPGFIGRDPWKNADLVSFGRMLPLAQAGHWRDWLALQATAGLPADTSALLPYWLGAWAIQALAPLGVAAELAVRLPYALMLAGTLAAAWYAVYHLARQPGAQPVAFAFGGEAHPADYARALADGGLLALIATLGLAQLSHETTPAAAQLFFGTLVFYGLAALGARPRAAALALAPGLLGLTLSGAPAVALAYALLGLLTLPARAAPGSAQGAPPGHGAQSGSGRPAPAAPALLLAVLALACLALAWPLGLLHWAPPPWRSSWHGWASLARMFLWFTWPVWPLALWTLWRWRRQLLALRQHRHLGLPLLIASVPLAATVLTQAGDRALLLALPALAALAALALPTFSRAAAALIDWFTVLFFTGWAIVIWVVWVSLQTGVPAKPAANVARLAPGFETVFQWPAFAAAVLGTLAWVALARWRTGRHRTALWKSLVLPAAGTALCWLLLMTLWLPALNYGRSYAPQMAQLRRIIGPAACVQVRGLTAAQITALHYHGGWRTVPANGGDVSPLCPWLLLNPDAPAALRQLPPGSRWQLQARVRRPTDRESLAVLRPADAPPPAATAQPAPPPAP